MPFVNSKNVPRLINTPNPDEKYRLEPYTMPMTYVYGEEYFTDKDYFCVSVSNHEVVPHIKDFLTDVLDEIRNGSINLLITQSDFETTMEFVEAVYDLLDELSIHIDNVTHLTGLQGVNKLVEQVSIQRNMPPYRIVVYPVMQFFVQQLSFNVDKYSELPTLKEKKYDKKFIFPNKRWRVSRPLLVGMLGINKSLSLGKVSLSSQTDAFFTVRDNWKTAFQNIIEFHDIVKNEETLKLFLDNKDYLLNLPDMIIDSHEQKTGLLSDHLPIDYYNDVYFSVISETICLYPDTIQGRLTALTEKTFFMIAYGMPFIVYAASNILSMAKDMGYKTFSPYIDESYDLEENDLARGLMIAEEIKRLANLNDEEIIDFINNVTPICEHNFNVLKNKKYPHDFMWEER